jgi:hypothetical protein
MKALYLGTWNHIQPVLDFPETKDFIFIDTQPRSEFDNDKSFHLEFYKPHFVLRLFDVCNSYGFELIKTVELDPNYYKQIFTVSQRLYYSFHPIPEYINPTLLIFIKKKTQQTIKYYISTNIEYNMDILLAKSLSEYDSLIVSGYFPKKYLFSFFNQAKTFIGYTQTKYKIDNDDEHGKDSIMNPDEWSKYFDNIIQVDYTTGKKTKLNYLSDLF